MQERRARFGKLTVAAVLALIIATATAGGLGLVRFITVFHGIELRLADLRVSLLAEPEPQDPDIVIVTITDETLAQFPYRSPVDRWFLADLLERLDVLGVHAIGIDIIFDQPSEPAKDARLRAVLSRMRTPLVAAWADERDQLTKDQTDYLADFLGEVPKGFAALDTSAADGIVRWIPAARDVNGKTVLPFAKALAARLGIPVSLDRETIAYRRAEGRTALPFAAVPAHTAALWSPSFPEPARTRFEQSLFKDRIVLIGFDLPYVDRHQTPLVAGYGTQAGSAPGVVIHAHALAQLLQGRTAPASPLPLVIAVGVLAAMAGAAAAWPRSTVVQGGLLAGALALIWVGGFAMYAYTALLTPVLGPSFSLSIAFAATQDFVTRRLRRHNRFIRQAFSQFTSAAVVDQLLAEPERLSLGGERREITCLFTDLAGFTTLMETLDPALAVDTLNQYLGAMCDIVFDHGGTIDKVVGDAVHAMFNAPLDQPDHGRRAYDCALAMDRFGQHFMATMAVAGVPFGLTRIGVHAGPAVVGNFGGNRFFDYTAHGDTVNTAARLEGANKYLGTRICVSATVVALCGAGMVARPVGTLILKGKTEGLAVYEPLPEDSPARATLDDYAQAFALMKAGDAAAREAFARLHKTAPGDTLIAFHAGRLAAGEIGVTIRLAGK